VYFPGPGRVPAWLRNASRLDACVGQPSGRRTCPSYDRHARSVLLDLTLALRSARTAEDSFAFYSF
jgi:hypothetical protein